MSTSETTGLLGLIFGLIGTTIGLFNYLRDQSKVVVLLQWDMAMTGSDTTKRFGLIKVTNVGRRAVYISHVALRLPRGEKLSHLLIRDGITGQKLSEGDPPAVFTVDQSSVEAYASKWQEIVVQVSDSTGKEWISKKATAVPSWAKAPRLAVKTTAGQ